MKLRFYNLHSSTNENRWDYRSSKRI